MATDEELDRFDAWRKEEARRIRHRAAAFGHPAEYEYLKQYPFILERYREIVPTWGTANMDSVLREACDDSIELDLAEINRIRKEWDEPPLDFIPDVVGEMRFDPPKPKVRPPPDEQERQFYEWAREEVSRAYHYAKATGCTPSEAVFLCPWMVVGRIVRHFPAFNPAWCLRQLEFCLTWMRPEDLDPVTIESMKSWHTAIQETGEAIEKLAAQKKDPGLKQ